MLDHPNPRALAKASIDVGYFTAEREAMLAFWREDIGLSAEEPVHFNNTLTQYRHALGDSVLKINTSAGPLPNPPSGYRELLIARPGLTAPERLRDPDGNAVTLVPPGTYGISGVGIRVAAADPAREAAFYRDVMGFEAFSPGHFRSGDSVLILDQDETQAAAGHWIGRGLRYFTLHVMRVDRVFEQLVAAGAEIGERPYAIARIARISFVRDPFGNWIEVAQRAALAGPWWD